MSRLLVTIAVAGTVGAAGTLATCDQMIHQSRYDSYEPSALFADGKSLQAPPDGAVSRDWLVEIEALNQRPALDAALLRRGHERYGIFCSPCHDVAGYGRGVVPGRGFPNPPSFHIARLRQAPSSHFVDVITDGHGVMYSYAARVPPRDRWAIAAYIRALQLSQNAPLAALTSEERGRLEAMP